MRANVLSKQTIEPKMTGSSSQLFSLFLRSKVLKALLGLFIFSIVQIVFGATLPSAFSVAPNAAYAVSVQEAVPAGTEVSADVDAVVVSFAQPMDTAQSLPAADLRIDGSAGVDFDLMGASWDAAGTTLTLPLTGELEWETTYTVNIWGLSSALGIPMFFAHTHIFMTEVNPLDAGISLIVGVEAVDAGIGHSIALRDDGNLWAWGDNRFGQLGLDIAANSEMAPTLIDPPAGVDFWKYFAAGYHHTLAICNEGKLWAWGRNNQGQLGLGDTTNRRAPVEVPMPATAGAEWLAVAAGENFTVALCGDGILWSWGNNAFGQLGIGSTTGTGDRRVEPEKVFAAGVSGNTWTHIAVGSYHVVAAREDGSLWAWGHNHGVGIGHTGIPIVGGVLFITEPTEIPLPAELASAAEWKSIAVGAYSTFALCGDGDLWAWGLNGRGQLGLGNIISGPFADIRTSPERVGLPGEWDDVAVGYTHTLGLRYDGTLWAWGYNRFGQLGIGSTNVHEASPTLVDANVSPNEWISLAAGYDHTLAVLDDGTLWAWGDNEFGQLGKGVTGAGASVDNTVPWRLSASLVPTSDTDMTVADDATIPNRGAAGVEDDTITIRFNRAMYTGEDSLSARTAADFPGTIVISDGASVDMAAGTWSADNTVFTAPLNLVASDTLHTATVEGFVDDFLKVEVSSHEWTFTTGKIETGAPVGPHLVQIASGLDHTIAIRNDGTLWAWGDNDAGQLGFGDRVPRDIPTMVPDAGISGTAWTAVAAGDHFSIALRDDGSLWAWGNNGNGRLGIGNTVQQLTPTAVLTTGVSGTVWTDIVAGNNFALGLRNGGNLYAWGNNGQGRLGVGDTAQRTAPTAVLTTGVSGTAWTDISAGGTFAAAIRSDGTLWTWGNNTAGQLGLNDTTNRTAPYAVVATGVSGTEWIDVSTGTNFTIALRNDGTLWAWGSNGGGRLGVGDMTQRLTPAAVVTTDVSGTGWTDISTGDNFALAVRNDGSLWAWGGNGDGRLGLGDTLQRTAPAEVSTTEISGDEWTLISAGNNFSIAARDDGTLWSWGNNALGQLGKGITGAGQGDGTNNRMPWRVAASLESESTSDWTVADTATVPNHTAVNVVDDTIIIRFDRPMRAGAAYLGTIAINNGATVNVAAGTWSEGNTVFTAPLNLVTSHTLHTATIQGFVDDFLGHKGSNEMHSHTWTFTTGEVEGDLIVYTYEACATCHFTESVRLEHQFVQSRGIVNCSNAPNPSGYYDYGCQKCHGQGFTPNTDKVNWSRISDCADPMYELNEAGCMSCHGSSDRAHVLTPGRMLNSHAIADYADSGCAGSGCHGPLTPDNTTGFSFGTMDLASTHADYWLAVASGDSTSHDSGRSAIIQEESPFGCGSCHERADNDSRLRSPIVTRLENVDPITCTTCHIAPTPGNVAEMTAHLNQRRLHPDLRDYLDIVDLPTSLGIMDVLRNLSAQVRAELGLDVEGESLEAGVLEPICPAASEVPTSIESTIAVGAFTVHPGWCGPDCELCGLTDPGGGNVSTPPTPCPCLTGGTCNCGDGCGCDPVRCTCTSLPTTPTPPPPVGCDNYPCSCCVVCDYCPCRCCTTCDNYPCTCVAAVQEEDSATTSRDPNAGPRTGDVDNWFVQMAIISALVATVATSALIVTRKPKLEDE